MEILHSRVADTEQERELPSKCGPEEVERAETSYGKQNVSADVEEESDKFKSASSTPFPRASVSEVIHFPNLLFRHSFHLPFHSSL